MIFWEWLEAVDLHRKAPGMQAQVISQEWQAQMSNDLKGRMALSAGRGCGHIDPKAKTGPVGV